MEVKDVLQFVDVLELGSLILIQLALIAPVILTMQFIIMLVILVFQKHAEME